MTEGRWQSTTLSLTHSISSNELQVLSKSPIQCTKHQRNSIKNNKYVDLAINKNHEFVPLVAESLGGLGKAAIKLFAEIARSQASPIGTL